MARHYNGRVIHHKLILLMRPWFFILLLLGAGLFGHATVKADAEPRYELQYHAKFTRDDAHATAEMRLGRGAELLKSLRLRIKPDRHADFEGRGVVTIAKDHVIWEPDGEGAWLRWTHKIDNRRANGLLDARKTADWALLRGDNLFPAAVVRSSPGARSNASLHFDLPKGWAAETAWEKVSATEFKVDNPDRRFARPVGWMIVGSLGIRRDKLPEIELVVAGPTGAGPRRMDILSFINFVIPEYQQAFGRLPPKFLVVGADEPGMWRGGLSGPNSFYLHPDLSLISENATSTLLHEMVHTVNRISAAPRHDWIVEGIAEFYAVELLYRAGGMSDDRYRRTWEWLANAGSRARDIYADRARGPITWQGATIMRALDLELRAASDEQVGLDELVRDIMDSGEKVSLRQLRTLAEQRIGKPARSLRDAALPGRELPEDQP